jgi:hypothetical protein
MAHQPEEGIPDSLIAGDTWKWSRAIAGHPASDGWGLRYELSLSGGSVDLTIDATPDGDGWSVVVPAATTSALAAGQYRWAEYLLLDDERFTVQSGNVKIGSVLHETLAARMVRLIREAIEDIVQGRSQQVNINSRGKTLLSLADLRAELQHWEAVLEQEERPGFGPQIAARMQAPGFVGGRYPFPFRNGFL